MKTFLKISVLALGLGAGTSPILQAATADDNDGGRDRLPRMRAMSRHPAMIRGHVARLLELSPEQRAQFKAGRENARNALKAIRADESLTREQKREKARATLEEARSHLRSVLKPGQQVKIDNFREQRREKRAGR